MLYRNKDLIGRTLSASDGEVGKVTDLYFDDDTWTVRYLVVDTGSWLSSRSVLISPQSLGAGSSREGPIPATLSREQVENSPRSETHRPVSRQHEADLASHYGYPTYWFEAGFSGTGLIPINEAMREARRAAHAADPASAAQDSHLRSVAEIVGYHIQATDGEIGHVSDFGIDPQTWQVREMIIDTRNWLPGKHVRIDLPTIREIDWHERKVHVALPREQIKSGAEADAK
ncbi:PRC-barrel domain-containing protein [Piscinibacter sakaiensis]|uniref:PRC-barrel domain-containing protein n=1 Tax=Piscinibacter sakaiensis TaxID=1547922 RepID=UPI003AABA169